jgi:hypothetical protein
MICSRYRKKAHTNATNPAAEATMIQKTVLAVCSEDEAA